MKSTAWYDHIYNETEPRFLEVDAQDIRGNTPLHLVDNEALVNCLLSISNTLLHALGLWWIGKAFWALHMKRSLANIAIISFDPFGWLEQDGS